MKKDEKKKIVSQLKGIQRSSRVIYCRYKKRENNIKEKKRIKKIQNISKDPKTKSGVIGNEKRGVRKKNRWIKKRERKRREEK